MFGVFVDRHPKMIDDGRLGHAVALFFACIRGTVVGTPEYTLAAQIATMTIKPCNRRFGCKRSATIVPRTFDVEVEEMSSAPDQRRSVSPRTWMSPPYLHDGSAPTLQDAINRHVDVNLTAAQVQSLAAFIRQVDPSDPLAPSPPPTGCSLEQDFETGSSGWTTAGTYSTGTFVFGTPTEGSVS